MLNAFYDIVKCGDSTFQLHCAGKMYKIEFDEENQLKMFEDIISSKGKKYSELISSFKKNYPQNEILKFFKGLKDNGFIFYETDDSLLKGFLFDPVTNLNENLNEKSIGIVVSSENKIGLEIVKSSELNKANLSFLIYSSVYDEEKIAEFVGGKDFIIVDSTSYIPSFLQLFNEVAIKNSIPWLLVSCLRYNRGFVGPLFYGEETGCYNCYDKRVKSALPKYNEFLNYENWIDKRNKPSKMGNIEISFIKFVYSFAIIETKKFLLSYGFPHTYKRLLEIDFDDYTTTWHNLYKVPFCPHCNSKRKYSSAPWLDSISLEKLKP
ncbi:MAG: TOMM precursor leader peptide-binding protein [Bacteroidales bacterium]|jgi:bacteriocin biosynthesis cyclodehydratase domain-containing protein|nr:TOMM precursor leader peptide-binding protein [Bacteroidales bacterium]